MGITDPCLVKVKKLISTKNLLTQDFLAELTKCPKADRIKFLTTLIAVLNSDPRNDSSLENIEDFNEIIDIILCGLLEIAQNEGNFLNVDSASEIVNFFITESRHFRTSSLVGVIVKAIFGFIQNENVMNLSCLWVEFVASLFNATLTRGDIVYDGDLCDVDTFRKHIINDICSTEWTANKVPSIISLLRELPGIETVQIKMILDKINTVLSCKTFDASWLPPIAYQLLSFSSKMNQKKLINQFDIYFPITDWANDEEAGDEFDSASSNSSQAGRDMRRKALGTTVFHFVQAARNSETLIKEIMKRIKMGIYDHNLVMTPFMLSLSLGLTSIETMKKTILDSLKSTIVKCFLETEVSNDHAWFETVRILFVRMSKSHSEDVMDLFRPILDHRELEFMVEGLKDLAISLLNVDSLQNKDRLMTEKSQKLGNRMIVAIVQKYKDAFPLLINDLLKSNSPPYNDALANCLGFTTTIVIQSEMFGRVLEIIHQLPLMSVECAHPIIKALLPALQLSPNLLGELLMILRKTIWKSPEARRVSVTAMNLLLSNSKIIGDIPQDKYSESQTLFFSQATTNSDVEETNKNGEPICYEVFSIIKRYFLLQAEVRECLYTGLCSVVKKNPELVQLVSTHLTVQLKQYMNGTKNALVLIKVIEINKKDSTIMEDLGLLTQCCAQVCEKISHIYEEEENKAPNIIALETLFQEWIQCLVNVTPQDIETQATNIFSLAGLSSKSLDTVQNVRTLLTIQVIQSLEALIEHLSNGTGNGNMISKLFSLVLSLEVTIKEDKKKLGNKKEDAKKAKEEKPKQLPVLEVEKRISRDFTHIMSLENVLRLLNSIYKKETSGGSWLNKVSFDYRFEYFLLSVVCQKVERLRGKKGIRERYRTIPSLIQLLGSIGSRIWNECRSFESPAIQTDDLEMMEEIGEEKFRFPLRLKAISSILHFVYHNHPSFMLQMFEHLICDPDVDLVYSFDDFFEHWKLIFDKYSMMGLNIAGLEFLLIILGFGTETLSSKSGKESITKVFEFCSSVWLNKPRGLQADDGSLLAQTFIPILMKSEIKLVELPKSITSLAFMTYCVMGDTYEPLVAKPECESPRHSWFVTKASGEFVFAIVVKYVQSSLNTMDEILSRLKTHLTYNCQSGEDISDEGILILEATCRMMNFLARILLQMVKVSIPAGQCVDIMLSTLPKFFNAMTALSEVISEVSTKHETIIPKEFEELVKLIGRDLKSRIEGADGFIIYIESIQRVKAEEAGKKKNPKFPMKLKLTKDGKMIPRLVYAMEKYEQFLISLEQRAKVSLLRGTKKSTARDFKIHVNQMADAVQSMDEPLQRGAESPRNQGETPNEEKPGANKKPVKNRKKMPNP